MSANSLAGLFGVYDIVGSQRDEETNSITCQLGSAENQETELENCELWQQYGFVSRPPNASAGPDGATQALAFHTSGHPTILATKDHRSQELYGKMKPGSACIFATGENGTGMARILVKGNGDIVLFTTEDNTETGAGTYFKIGPSGLEYFAPWGTMSFDSTGFHVSTQYGAKLDLGGVSIPAPLDALASYATLTAATVTAAGNLVFLGKNATQAPFAAAYSLTPPPAPSTPILNSSPASTLAAGSTSVFVGI
jgi:hypothetical protein